MTRTRMLTAIMTVAFSLAMILTFQNTASASDLWSTTYRHTDAQGVSLGGLGFARLLTSPDAYPAVLSGHIEVDVTVYNDTGWTRQYVQSEVRVWRRCADGVNWCNPTAMPSAFVLSGGYQKFAFDIGPVPGGEYYVQVRYFWWNNSSWTGGEVYQNVGIAKVVAATCPPSSAPGNVCIG